MVSEIHHHHFIISFIEIHKKTKIHKKYTKKLQLSQPQLVVSFAATVE